MRDPKALFRLRLEAIVTLVRASDFKSDGMRRKTHPAGSIPVRFRQPIHENEASMKEDQWQAERP